MKKIVYIDMDGVLVDFHSAIQKLSTEEIEHYKDKYDMIDGFFYTMEPFAGAIDGINKLQYHFDLYLLSTATWYNPSAWSDKLKWVKKYFGEGEDNVFYKKLILSHNKHLNLGSYLIDDRLMNGADRFTGKHIHFGSEEFPNWEKVTNYLLAKI
jgi:5'(3')-deoxyribonucleotidase